MKTLEDVNRVIDAGKPDAVVQVFIEEYLTGVALAPFIKAEEEYAVLKATPDTPDIEAIVGEKGEIIIPAASPNTKRDAQIAELEGEYPYLVEPGGEEVSDTASRRPEPVLDLAEYKRLWLKHQLSKFNPINLAAETPFGFSVDADRDDISNMERLYRRATDLGMPEITIRAADDTFHTLATVDLPGIINAQIDYGFGLYQRKWAVEKAIIAAVSVDDVVAVAWSDAG